MTIHQNSRDAYATLDLAQRDKEVVLAFWGAGGSATDRQIASMLGKDDLNYCRPTITRLTERGILRETGSIICPVTNKTVRVSTLNPVEIIAKLPPEEPMTEEHVPYVAAETRIATLVPPPQQTDPDTRIQVKDEPGPGGAFHHYLVSWLGGPVETQQPDGSAIISRKPNGSLAILFQKGGKQDAGANGITNENLLEIVRHRLACFQAGPCPCKENESALNHVIAALEMLRRRTAKRQRRGVEGKNVK